jgi:serine/threonine-protein kinase
MAEIYLARARTELGAARLVVVKQILQHLSGNEKFSEMLIAEAKLAARLNHANVVQVFDLGRHDNVLFIAMEYVEGFDLNDLLKRCAKSKIALPIDFALLVVTEALRGLDYAHRRRDDAGERIDIVHRDVSPSNVLISFEGEIKLCDFGIARANDIADVLTEDAIKGKAGYMSPEQARGENLDCRADIFAAGIILWELLSGRKLYKAPAGSNALLDMARSADIPPFVSRELPNEDRLRAIVAKALAPNRDDRYESAHAFLCDLEEYVGVTRQVASPIRFGEWLREHFEAEILHSRRARERAAKAIEYGPALLMKTVEMPMAFEAINEPQSPHAEPAGSFGDMVVVNTDSRRHEEPAAEMDVTTDPPPVVDSVRPSKFPLGVRQRMEAEAARSDAKSTNVEAQTSQAIAPEPPVDQLPINPSLAPPPPAEKGMHVAVYIAVGVIAGLIAVALIVALR